MHQFIEDLKTVKEKYEKLKTLVELGKKLEPVLKGFDNLKDIDIDELKKSLGITDSPKTNFQNTSIKKLCIYSAIIGNGDTLHPISKIDGVDCILFANPDYQVEGWETHIVERKFNDSRKTARMYKILPHKFLPEYGVWLWIDGNCHIIKDISNKINEWFGDCEIAGRKHPNRHCVYDEIDECKSLNKASKEKLEWQRKRYLNEEYPKNNSVIETSMLLRKNTPAIQELNEAWWKQIESYTKRDQISLPYVIWKLGLKYNLFNNEGYINKYPHQRR